MLNKRLYFVGIVFFLILFNFKIMAQSNITIEDKVGEQNAIQYIDEKAKPAAEILIHSLLEIIMI